MKLATLFYILCFLLFAPIAQAQLTEDFESGSKGGYAAGDVELASGSWHFYEALLGSDSGDRTNGSQSARIDNRDENGYIRMNFDKSDGADEVRFYAANAGFSGDDGGVLQVAYSTDGGGSWNNLGDEIQLDDELTEYAVEAGISGDIRFEIRTTDGGRVSVDDVFISDFVEAADEPTLRVRHENTTLDDGYTHDFASASTGSTHSVSFTLHNHGNETLEFSSAELQEEGAFSVSDISGHELEFNESAEIDVTFTPESAGSFENTLTINSNADNTPEFTIHLSGSGVDESEVMPIAEAREVEFGTRVTVAGWITVTDEFSGPAVMQDNTAGISVYYPEMHSAVEHGDSVVVTGPVTEFNPIGGTPRTFLRQIAEHDGDDDISFEIYPEGSKQIEPEVITLEQMNSGGYESQLVQVDQIDFQDTGAFEGETDYTIIDQTGEASLRLDGDTNIPGADIPEETSNLLGVVDRFAGTYQLKPRSTEDLGVEEAVIPGEDIDQELTFDVVTWNIEWFGGNNGPDDNDLQFENVVTVIETIDADLYALQEIANVSVFSDLVNELDGFSGFTADYSQQQKTAYLFRESVIDSVDSGLLTEGQDEYNWAYRLPLHFEFEASVGDVTRSIHSYNVHAKAMGDEDSRDRREDAAEQLKTYIDENHGRANENAIFIGDYNDMLTTSTASGMDSPYRNFVEDDDYLPITKTLEERGMTSYRSRSMIDHITVTEELIDDYFEGTERIENTHYIGSYLSTTSDHYPVWVRFDFDQQATSVDDQWLVDQPESFELRQNYPNPFNPVTNISFTLPESDEVNVTVYDMLGREVSTLMEGRQLQAGTHEVQFDGNDVSSGVYLYRVELGSGQQLSRQMTLVK